MIRDAGAFSPPGWRTDVPGQSEPVVLRARVPQYASPLQQADQPWMHPPRPHHIGRVAGVLMHVAAMPMMAVGAVVAMFEMASGSFPVLSSLAVGAGMALGVAGLYFARR